MEDQCPVWRVAPSRQRRDRMGAPLTVIFARRQDDWREEDGSVAVAGAVIAPCAVAEEQGSGGAVVMLEVLRVAGAPPDEQMTASLRNRRSAKRADRSPADGGRAGVPEAP